MQLGTYCVTIQFKEPAHLPTFKGSALRGSFGRSLKQVCCALRRQNCSSCMLRSQCVYAKTFEFQKSKQGPAVPHPYILQPPETKKQDFSIDEQLDFSLTLFGPSNQHLPYYVYAMEQMGQYGLGRSTDSGKGCFFVKDVQHNGISIYSRAEQLLNIPPNLPELILGHHCGPADGVLNLNMLTPLRLKHQNRFARDLSFGLFVRAILRRLSSVTEHFGGGEFDLPYRELVQKADLVATSSSDLRWVDIVRYSSRQQTKMLIGGITGIATYEGSIGEYIPLIAAAQQLNIGKQTVFGLGRFTWEWMPNE